MNSEHVLILSYSRTEKALEESGISIHPPKRSTPGTSVRRDSPVVNQPRLRRSDVEAVSEEDSDEIEGNVCYFEQTQSFFLNI